MSNPLLVNQIDVPGLDTKAMHVLRLELTPEQIQREFANRVAAPDAATDVEAE